MENIKYIELSYCDMNYMLRNQKTKKLKIYKNLLEIYKFGNYALVKVIKGINELQCYYPSYYQQVYYEEKAKEIFQSNLSDTEKKQKQLEIINQFIKTVTK